MASSVSICDICISDNITKSASVWCSECEEAICNDCERQHSRMGLTKNHNTISIKDYQKLPSSVAAIKQKCIRHKLKFDFYCVIHNEPCCVSCVAEKHGTCQKLKSLSEVVEGVKSSAAFADVEDRTKDISTLIDNLITEKQNNRASFGVQKNEIISEMKNVRTAINNHLDALQKELLDKLLNEEKIQNGHIDTFLEKLSEIRLNVEKISSDLKKIKQHASNFQAFLGIHEWDKKIEKEVKDWRSLQTDNNIENVEIHLELTPTLVQFKTDVSELGKIKVTSSSATVISLNKEKQGQTLSTVSHTVDNIKLTQILSFQTPSGVSRRMLITGVEALDDGRIVLADNQTANKRLVIMNKDGQFIRSIQLDTSFDVTVLGNDVVAVTLFEKQEIVLVDINLAKVQKSIPTEHNCLGIAYTGEELVVSLDNKTFQFFDLSGKTSSTISKLNCSSHCSVFENNIYYTVSSTGSLYSTALNGDVQWKFVCLKSDHLSGISTDACGNVFIACRDSKKVIVVGKDGKESKVLLTEIDGLQKPRAIHYNRKTNTLVVCNISGKCFLYQVTY